MPLCDGCAREVDEAHIRQRIERLQQATRFRPIHIHALVLDACPPASPIDFFYKFGVDRTARCAEARTYFDELAKCAKDASLRAATENASAEEEILTEWQRRGLFLAHPVECSVEPATDLQSAIARSERTLQLRLQTSFKPKFIALVSARTQPLVEVLRANGWAERLLLDDGKPFDGPGFGDRLSAAISRI